MKISIIGGGIAGLTTAIAFKKAGIETEIFESAPEIKPLGAGIGLAPNAIKAFEEIGIAEKIVPLGRRLPYFKILNSKGKVLSFTDSNVISSRFGIDNFTIHRHVLHKALLSELENTPIFTGKRAVGIDTNSKEVVIQFEDGTHHQTPYLIIADGIHSLIRNKLAPNAKVRYSGYTCWRAVIDTNEISQEGASETWGTSGRFGTFPMADNKLYWYACINAPEKSAGFSKFKSKDLSDHFKNFHDPIPQIINQTKNENLLHHDICDLDPLDHFAFGNVLLVGDAAHAMTPNMGQGAGQAIEDAVVLGIELKKNKNIPEAFKSFETRRISRTRNIVLRSRTIGKIAQNSNPVLSAFRDMMIKITPARIQEKQFEMLYNIKF